MKTEPEIRAIIDTLITKIKDINKNPEKYNLFLFRDNCNKKIECLVKITHMYEILDESVPKEVFDLMKAD